MGAGQAKSMESYVEQFTRTLNHDYGDDAACMRITANKEFAEYCAVMLRRYADPDFTSKVLVAERKARMVVRRAAIVKAVDGLEAAANLYTEVEPETAAFLDGKAAELQPQLARVDELLDTQRHGKVRDHGILDVALREMEKTLGRITDRTLANLVNAAFLTHGIYQEPVTEEMVRRNLANFRKRNVNWDSPKNR